MGYFKNSVSAPELIGNRSVESFLTDLSKPAVVFIYSIAIVQFCSAYVFITFVIKQVLSNIVFSYWLPVFHIYPMILASCEITQVGNLSNKKY